jgi:hypothetical protein
MVCIAEDSSAEGDSQDNSIEESFLFNVPILAFISIFIDFFLHLQ